MTEFYDWEDIRAELHDKDRSGQRVVSVIAAGLVVVGIQVVAPRKLGGQGGGQRGARGRCRRRSARSSAITTGQRSARRWAPPTGVPNCQIPRWPGFHSPNRKPSRRPDRCDRSGGNEHGSWVRLADTTIRRSLTGALFRRPCRRRSFHCPETAPGTSLHWAQQCHHVRVCRWQGPMPHPSRSALVARRRPASASQSSAFPSWPPVTRTTRPASEFSSNATDHTCPEWPRSVAVDSPAATSHSRTAPSAQPAATVAPSGLNATDSGARLHPGTDRRIVSTPHSPCRCSSGRPHPAARIVLGSRYPGERGLTDSDRKAPSGATRSGGRGTSRATPAFRIRLVQHHPDQQRQRVVRQQLVRLVDLTQVKSHTHHGNRTRAAVVSLVMTPRGRRRPARLTRSTAAEPAAPRHHPPR